MTRYVLTLRVFTHTRRVPVHRPVPLEGLARRVREMTGVTEIRLEPETGSIYAGPDRIGDWTYTEA